MSQTYECSECHKDMATGEIDHECECFANALLDCTTKIDDLMKLVERYDFGKKLNA